MSMIGASGSGKSTFLRCINFLEMPTKGDIIVSGEKVELKTGRDGNCVPADRQQLERIRTRLGMVFQSFNLWQHMTVLENVIEAPVHVLEVPKAEAIARGRRLLNKVGLYERQINIRRSCRAASSSARRLRGRWLWSQGDAVRRADFGARPRARGRSARVIRDLAERAGR